VAFSPDGKYVLTGSTDETARLWDVQNGQEIRKFTPAIDNYTGHAVAFSPDGRYVLKGSNLWDARTGKEVRHDLGGQSSTTVIEATFSPNGMYLLTVVAGNSRMGGGEKKARLWEVQTGREVREFADHARVVSSIAFSPDGQYVLTGSEDGTARLWEFGNWFEAPSRSIAYGTESVAFSPDGKYLLTSSYGKYEKTARLRDAQTGQELRQFLGHTEQISSMAFSPDGKEILTGSWDKTARLWDTQTGQQLSLIADLGPQADTVDSVAFSPDGKYMLVGGIVNPRSDQYMQEGTVGLWDAQTRQQVGSLPRSTTLAVSPDSKYILTSNAIYGKYEDPIARLWDVATKQEVREFVGHERPVGSLAFSPDGKYVLTGSADNTVRLWDAHTGKQVRLIPHVDPESVGAASAVAFSPDGKYFLVGSQDETRLWDTQTGQLVRIFADGAKSVAFSPDGKTVLTLSKFGLVFLWDLDYHDRIKWVCSRLLRDLTDEERVQYGITGREPTCKK
jgi:uncharacterized delta-60 repeat protein